MIRKMIATALVATTVFVNAQDAPKIDWSADFQYNNKYVWRGVNLNDDGVFQPSLTMTSNGFSVCFWGNFDLGGANKGRFNEVDTTLSYSGEVNGAAFSLGWIMYDFPNTGGNSTSEVFGTYTLNQAFSPTISVYKDIDEFNGYYVSLSGNQNLEGVQQGGMSFDTNVSAWLGYGDEKHNNAFYGNNESGLADWGVALKFSTDLGQGKGYLRFGYTGLFDSQHLAGQPNRSNFIWGAGYSFSF